MQRSTSRGSALTVAALALGIVAVAVVGIAGTARTPAPSEPTPTPVVTPRPSHPTEPSPLPSDPVQDQFEVDLDTAGGHDIDVVVVDDTGKLAGAKSGHAADGMSIRWSDVDVVNVDEDTLRITWAGFPRDESVGVSLAERDGQLVLVIVQQQPYPNTDAMGADRVLILDFDEPVDANDVVASVKESRDTDD